ncbi:hypothetical protein FZEAL_2676 [Fusarium zealandicum]|uniref:NmrA-like domain-containing protein n=1 Tax=Fusarium zealandicum TaxID=1053134 RepID=A0A8H4UQC0_9HYPO|nr:hypothetical protein FZEAL_2676 [Fusarium zealandicum]
MVKIAIAAASSELAREVIDKLVATNKHEITALVRKDPSLFPTLPGVTWVQTDYAHKEALVQLLKGIHTVLCFLAVHFDPDNESQKRLIDASVEAGVKRYAPSEWSTGVALKSSIDVMTWYTGKVRIQEYLEELNRGNKVLEYTLFQTGFFMDFLACPHKSSKHIVTLPFSIDLEKMRAFVVEGSLNQHITYTNVEDIVNIVALAVDYEGKWPVVGGIRGHRVTTKELLEIANKVRGRPLEIEWLKQEDLMAGELKTNNYSRLDMPSATQDQIEAFSKTVTIGVLLAINRGAWTVSDEWNRIFPDYQFTQVEEFVDRFWKGHLIGWAKPANQTNLSIPRVGHRELTDARSHPRLSSLCSLAVVMKADSEEDKERTRDKVGDFVYAPFLSQVTSSRAPFNLDLSVQAFQTALLCCLMLISHRKKHFNKGELALKHAAGLGQQPNAVPLEEPIVNGPLRPVEVGWHPVGGFAGKWFAEETGLGKMITESINTYPDPTQHWAVLVGDYAHQLWMVSLPLVAAYRGLFVDQDTFDKDESFDVIYTNEKINREEWRTFQVGETRFNDDATRRAGEWLIIILLILLAFMAIAFLFSLNSLHAGESVIQSMREKQPTYNLITNNCQTYALQLLDAIKVGVDKEFGTTLAVYERLIGTGKVKDLFSGDQLQDQIHEGAAAPAGPGAVSFAQQVMNDNTTQLETQEELSRHNRDKEDKMEQDEEESRDRSGKKSRKTGFFGRFKRS